MSYANGTTHFNLPQTVGTDKRDWTDTNQAFADVDAALYTAADTASTAASNISTLDAQINTPSTGIDARLTAAEQDIVSLDGRLDTAEGTIGQHTLDIADVRSDLQDAIVAYNEATATSTHAYSVGNYFFYNDILYKATTSIAIGDTIVPNTNCSATNVMTEVDAVNTALTVQVTDGAKFTSGVTTKCICRNGVVFFNVYGTAVNATAWDDVIVSIPAEYAPPVQISCNGNPIKFTVRTTGEVVAESAFDTSGGFNATWIIG